MVLREPKQMIRTDSKFKAPRAVITDADVKKDPNRAHNCIVPGGGSPKDKSGKFLCEDVWRYLFTHPVDQTGKPVPADPKVRMDQRKK